VYCAHPAGAQGLVFARLFDEAFSLRQGLVWNKGQMVLGHSDYHYSHEPILYGYTAGPGRRGRGGEGTPARIALAEKERRALELRKGGATYNRIAQVLGYSDEGGAAKAVKRALADTLQEPAAEIRKLEAERLDAMQSALWPAALSGKPIEPSRLGAGD
jgi:hypothetical protein